MSETKTHIAHFWIDGPWLGNFVRTAYWYEHRQIYAKSVLDECDLSEENKQKIITADVILSNKKDADHTLILINKPDIKAKKKLQKHLDYLNNSWIKLDNGRFVPKNELEEYIKNEWMSRRQTDYVERIVRYSTLGPEIVYRIMMKRNHYMNKMLKSSGVTSKSEITDMDKTQRLIIEEAEKSYKLQGLKPFPFEDYEFVLNERISDKTQEIFDEMDEIYKREYSEKTEKKEEYVPAGGKLPPLRLRKSFLLKREKDDKWNVATGKEREEAAFIDPKGVWWNVPFANHQAFANWMVCEKYPEYDGYTDYKGNRATDVLVQKGWLLINNTHDFGTTIVGNMNADQYVVLYEFFGNRPLVNGTVRALWRESPLNKES
jgi:hypothetical protein